MTPLVGLVIAVLAGLLAPSIRALLVSVFVAMAAATAVQTWDIGSGRGSNPPSTVHQVGYWIVQLIIISVIAGVAVGVFRLRSRRQARRGEPVVRPAYSGRRGAAVLVAAVAILTVLMVALFELINSRNKHHGVGAGNMPWAGVLGLLIGLVALVALVVALKRGSASELGAAGQVPDRASGGRHDQVTMSPVTAPLSRAGLGTRGQR